VGRSKAADIRLDLADLSRRHATLTVSEGGVLVRDEGSRNHTFVDGEQIEKEVAVSVGAQIVFGRVEARLIAGSPAGSPTHPPIGSVGEAEQGAAGNGEAQKDES
jgi:pSer/pThr/pTyr-binding forkhead associated (FHA) protein